MPPPRPGALALADDVESLSLNQRRKREKRDKERADKEVRALLAWGAR